jgi:hypothetical protein
MKLSEALVVALQDAATLGLWKQAERALVSAGLCPHCACNGQRTRLGKHEAATHETYAGRFCPSCEEFIPDSAQPDDCHERADYGGALGADGNVYSDALPGF